MRSRRRQSGESIAKLEADVRALHYRALGNEVNTKAGKLLGMDAFLLALNDPELEVTVRDREPKNLDEAVKLATRFESHSELAKQNAKGRAAQSFNTCTMSSSTGQNSTCGQEAAATRMSRSRDVKRLD